MSDFCAYQGEPGAFSEQAARQLVGDSAELLPCASFAALFEAVERSRVRWAVVPIENTVAGPVPESQAWLPRARVHSRGELRLRIRLALIARAGLELADVRHVLSHPMALRQCRKFFTAHPWMRAVPAHDTAGAVRAVLQAGERGEAAIAGAHCAELYGGQVLADDIGDICENYTRFLLVTPAREL